MDNTKTAEEMYQKYFLYGHDGIHDRWEKQVAQQIFDEQITPLKKRIEELEEALSSTRILLEDEGYLDTVKLIDELLNPSTNGK